MVLIRCLFVFSALCPTAAMAQISLRYDIPAGEKFGYRIRASVSFDGRKYVYSGYAEYEVLERAGDGMKLRFRGRLGGSDFKDSSRNRRPTLGTDAFLKGRADRDHDFPGMVEQEQTFQISSQGMIAEDADTKPLALPFYMGDLRTIVFEPLGEPRKAFWEVTRAVPIGSLKQPKPKEQEPPPRSGEFRLPKFSFPVELYERFDLSPATETRKYNAARAQRGTITIARADELMSIAFKMPFAGVGQAEWVIDAKTAKPISFDSKRKIQVNRDGELELALVELSYKLTSAEELAQYHASIEQSRERGEARRKAELAAAEKRREEAKQKEANRTLTRQEISGLLEQLDTDRGFERDKALRFLVEHPMAKRSRLIVQKLRKLAEKDDSRYASNLKRLEKAWEIDLDD
jgi:hypothetical protein